MPNTQGFDVVAELLPAALRDMMRAAWTSGGATGAHGVIPQNFDIPAGTAIGPYHLADGQVQIPQGELDVAMAPDVNGVDLKLGLHLQIEVQSPPVPSAGMFTLTADVHAKVPVAPIGSTINVGLILDPLPRANVTATLTSGDPIAPILDQLVTEYVHQSYLAGPPAFPHNIAQTGQTVSFYKMNTSTDLSDDPNDPSRAITVAVAAPQLVISIPIHTRIDNIVKDPTLPPAISAHVPNLFSPMGIQARLVITANDLTVTSGQVSADLSTATLTVQNLVPAGSIYGQEGPNYTFNRTTLQGHFVDLDALVTSQIIQQGQAMLTTMLPVSFTFPSVAQIEQTIGDAAYAQLVAQGSIAVWTPATGGSSPVQITDVTVKALADALAIGLNQGAGANAGALANFVPAGQTFAIAITASKVLDIVQQAIHRPESDGGFGPSFPHPPHRFPNVDGHKVDLTRLDPSLTSAIHMSGDVTVIDAILGSIDVDASFDVDIGLHWAGAPGSQILVADTGTAAVHLSGLAWLLTILIGFVTGGLVGVIIAVVVLEVVTAIATHIGGDVVRSGVADQVTGIGAWPAQLEGIGTVVSGFENPVGIDPDGLLFVG